MLKKLLSTRRRKWRRKRNDARDFLALPDKTGKKKGRQVIKENSKNMDKRVSDQEFLEFMIKNLVDHPEDVKVSRVVDEMGVLLTLKVNPEDMGQLIGRKGSTAKAIRALVRIVGLRNHARVNLKIEEPEGGRAPRKTEDAPRPSLDDLNI